MIMLHNPRNQPPKHKKELRIIDTRRRAILGAFAFQPYAGVHHHGLHSGEILRIAPLTFKRLLLGSHRDYSPAVVIASLCRSMCLMGYMQISGRVERTYQNHQYSSPKWKLTETGYWWILSNCNFEYTPTHTLLNNSLKESERLVLEVQFQRFIDIDATRTTRIDPEVRR
jgi:hypothetical protein